MVTYTDKPIQPSRGGTIFIPSLDHGVVNAASIYGTLGETVTIMQHVYYKSDGKWWLIDADTEATVNAFTGIVLHAGDADDVVVLAISNDAMMVRDDTWAWATLGAPLYYDDVAGALVDVALATDQYQRKVGFAYTADVAVLFLGNLSVVKVA